MAAGSVDETVRLAVELVVEVELLLAGAEKPEHALNESSPNRIVVRAVQSNKIVRAGYLCSAEACSAEPGKSQDIY